MTVPARKFDADPQQDREAALELLTTNDFYAASSPRYQTIRNRRSELRDQAAHGQPLAR